jgi:hypothetical protein
MELDKDKTILLPPLYRLLYIAANEIHNYLHLQVR